MSSDPTENGKSTYVTNRRISKSCRLVNPISHHSPRSTLTALSCSAICIIFLLFQRIFREFKASSLHFFALSIANKPFPQGKMRGIDKHLIDVSVLSANPKFASTGGRIIQKTPRIWAGGNSTGLFTNPLTASPLSFTASLPKQKLSRAKSRQLRRLEYLFVTISLSF